ncbi:MAG: tetratricopeptide (TPR) repeat protein [Dokdonia sp.]|jgi:tetratricopeptide (TPR) repeat protein
MIKVTNGWYVLSLIWMMSCAIPEKKPAEIKAEEQVVEVTPKEMLNNAYQLFKEGKDPESIQVANRVLEIGRTTKNDTLIGQALTSLCRNSQRKLDTTRLAELSLELSDLAVSSGNLKWLMYRAHMNAEMWRLIGDMDRAEGFYNESMKISLETGSMGMYTIDHFNKSFVSVAKGDFKTANQLIKKYYELRKESDPESEDAYGLIALAYLLEQQGNYEGAHEVAMVTRRLFEEQHLFPEPPDEKPLLIVEAKVKEELDSANFKTITASAQSQSVSNLLDKYLQ